MSCAHVAFRTHVPLLHRDPVHPVSPEPNAARMRLFPVNGTIEMNQNDSLQNQRIRERAYQLWEEDGRPPGRDLEYWERARELLAIEDNPGAGLLPNPASDPTKAAAPTDVEEAEIQENYGEFPARLTDQGDRQPTPEPRHSKRGRRKPRPS